MGMLFVRCLRCLLILVPVILMGCGGSSRFIDTQVPPTPNALACNGQAFRVYHIVPGQSSASYQVTEQLFNRDLPSTASGTTSAIQGTIEICATNPPALRIPQIQVDLRTLRSDSPRRDSAIQTNWLASNTYPFATFAATSLRNGPMTYSEGTVIAFELSGNLTIHGATRPQIFTVQGKVSDGVLTGSATTTIFMRDYGFDPPSVTGILQVKDGVLIVLVFTAKT